MSDLSVHEVLVKARNSIEAEGFNIMRYGLWGNCSTPRCALGWCGFYGGMAGAESNDLFSPTAPSAYRGAIAALWKTRPVEADEEVTNPGTPGRVEGVAFALNRVGVGAILAWFDEAIAATAPPPFDPSWSDLTEEVEATHA